MGLDYLCGFGNAHASEAIAGALPVGRNSPQHTPMNLYAEKLSGTAFTAPRADNARTWFYRLRPSVAHLGFTHIATDWQTAPQPDATALPDPLRWAPLPLPQQPVDFIDGMHTMLLAGDASQRRGLAVHRYVCNRSMTQRYFYNCDGELLIVPEQGGLLLHTEFGDLAVPSGYLAVMPRGVRFSVALLDDWARGYVCENYGARLQLPERGPIGSDGLANARDFEYPVAKFADSSGDFELLCKLDRHMYAARIAHSPLDVVAWHGNLAPYRYELRRFNVMGSTSYDHPDPSIFTVLHSPAADHGIANLDFVLFAPRWLVMADTFRPPWFHRNVMSEFMGLIEGEYDAKTGGGFVPGGCSLHNCMVPHGPDAATYDKAIHADQAPQYIDGSLAFMFESCLLLQPTREALQAPGLATDYVDQWSALQSRFDPPAG